MSTETEFRIEPARYAKGKFSLTPLDSRDGWKGNVSFLATAIGAKYSNRCRAYILSPAQAKKFLALFHAGWHGGVFKCLYSPGTVDCRRAYKNREVKVSRDGKIVIDRHRLMWDAIQNEAAA